jgi:hypothetical protein
VSVVGNGQLLGGHRPAGAGRPLDHLHRPAGAGEVRRGDEAIVAAADDDGVDRATHDAIPDERVIPTTPTEPSPEPPAKLVTREVRMRGPPARSKSQQTIPSGYTRYRGRAYGFAASVVGAVNATTRYER